MNISDFLRAAEAGAASIYHQVLATGTAIASWEADHPEIGPLISAGVTYANTLLARFGIPAETIEIAAEDIISALKTLVAHDATVPSVPLVQVNAGTTTTLAQAATLADEVATIADPAAALLIGDGKPVPDA